MMNPQLTEFAKHNLAQLAVFLNASDTKTQSQAIDEAVQVNSLLADAAVFALQNGQDRYFVAERLPNFGSITVEPLQALLRESADAEVKILAALVLLRLGSKVGVPTLLEALKTEPAERYAALIARVLAANGIGEAGAVIIGRLYRADLTAAALGKSFASNAAKDTAASLLADLKTLAVTLPPDLQQRLEAPDLPVEIRLAR